MLDESVVDEVIHVQEADTIRACHRMARGGYLFGGSTGTVVSGAMGWLAEHDDHDLTAVALAPDLGERYLDTVYQTNWVQDLYGADVSLEELTTSPSLSDRERPGGSAAGCRPTPQPVANRFRSSRIGIPVDALPVALPRPATAQHVNAALTEPVSPVTVRVPVVVPPTEPVSPVTGQVSGRSLRPPARHARSGCGADRRSCAGPVAVAFADVLAGVLGAEQVPVDSNFFDDLGADSMVMARFCARVRKQADLPSVSIKDVYQHPDHRGLATALAPAARSRRATAGRSGRSEAPSRRAEAFAEVLAGVLGVERVPVDAHFFDDLGADSMVMARFCARVRKRADLPSVSMKDIYQHSDDQRPGRRLAPPPVRGAGPVVAPAAAPSPAGALAPSPRPSRPAGPGAAGRRRSAHCGTSCAGPLQLLIFLGTPRCVRWSPCRASSGSPRASRWLDIYLRSVVFGGAPSSRCATLPIVAKWVLVGRWRPQQIRIWSLGYVRFWVVKTLVRPNPLALFAGSPLYVALPAGAGRQGRPRASRSSPGTCRSAPTC